MCENVMFIIQNILYRKYQVVHEAETALGDDTFTCFHFMIIS